MIEMKDGKFIIDGEPKIVIAGEIHYYRLKKDEWEDRIVKLKNAGLNAVASYIPWLCHQYKEDQLDLEGKTRPELNLAEFIDLCKKHDLYFFARPGPFIMAEMKNEGIPYWVYEKYPEIIPKTWDGKKTSSKMIDYLSPNFLIETAKWYKSLSEILKPRLYTNGGNIIAIQLDNEVGMLQWVSNNPIFTDNSVQRFITWLKSKYSSDELSERYPFDIDNIDLCKKYFISPQESFVLSFINDFGYFMRDYYTEYIYRLKSIFESFNIKNIPFVVNIHGTSNGGCYTFPIGISQLYKTYCSSKDIFAGTDIYIGDLSINKYHQLYIINSMMESVNNNEQILSSVEFECGSGDYNDSYSSRYSPASADLKARLCISQGFKLFNYYLFSGGYNYRLNPEPYDGNGRIAFTGERHGFAAPINPEGKLSYSYYRTSESVKTILSLQKLISEAKQVKDDIYLGFIPDYYMTEHYYPNSSKNIEFKNNLERGRTLAWDGILKASLMLGYNFGTVNIQDNEIIKEKCKLLIVPSAKYMAKKIQEKLKAFVLNKGRLFLYGEIPMFDMEGNRCTILADLLEVYNIQQLDDNNDYFLSVYPESWASNLYESRTFFVECYDINNADVFLREYETKKACGFSKNVGNGEVYAITTGYICNLDFYKMFFERINVLPKYSHNCEYYGVYITPLKNQNNGIFLSVINVDRFNKRFNLFENGKVIFDGHTFDLESERGIFLPINIDLQFCRIIYSTAEIIGFRDNQIIFRIGQRNEKILLKTDREVELSSEYKLEKTEEGYLITTQIDKGELVINLK